MSTDMRHEAEAAHWRMEQESKKKKMGYYYSFPPPHPYRLFKVFFVKLSSF